MSSYSPEALLLFITIGFFGVCAALGLFAPTLLFFAIGFIICAASVILSLQIWSIGPEPLIASGYSIGDVQIVSALGFGFGLLIFASGAVTNRLKRIESMFILKIEEANSTMNKDTQAPEKQRHSELLIDLAREHVRLLIDPLAGSNSNGAPLAAKMRIVAAISGAFAFHAAIGLYPYLFNGERIVRDFSISGLLLSSAISTFWIVFCGLLYAKYDRSADFAHVFRSSFLFNVLMYMTGKIAHLLIASMIS